MIDTEKMEMAAQEFVDDLVDQKGSAYAEIVLLLTQARAEIESLRQQGATEEEISDKKKRVSLELGIRCKLTFPELRQENIPSFVSGITCDSERLFDVMLKAQTEE